MTKAKARRQAIDLLGEQAVVERHGHRYLVGIMSAGYFHERGRGPSWERALDAARGTQRMLNDFDREDQCR